MSRTFYDVTEWPRRSGTPPVGGAVEKACKDVEDGLLYRLQTGKPMNRSERRFSKSALAKCRKEMRGTR